MATRKRKATTKKTQPKQRSAPNRPVSRSQSPAHSEPQLEPEPDSEPEPQANTSLDNHNVNPSNTRRGPFVYTSKQTIELLTTVIDANPWGQRHGAKGVTWRNIAQQLSDSPTFGGRRLTQRSVTEKVAELLASHEQPERTVFTETEATVYDSLIDRAKALRDEAATANEDKSSRLRARHKRQDCDGLRAREKGVKTYTEGKREQAEDDDWVHEEFDQSADNPHHNQRDLRRHHSTSPQPQPSTPPDARAARAIPPDATPSNIVTALSTSFGRFIQAESTRFERTHQVLVNIDNSLSQIASSQARLVDERQEHNRLLRLALRVNGPSCASSPAKSSNSSEPTEEDVPQVPGPLIVNSDEGEVEEHNKNVRPMTIQEKEEVLGMSRAEFEGTGDTGRKDGSGHKRPRTKRRKLNPTS